LRVGGWKFGGLVDWHGFLECIGSLQTQAGCKFCLTCSRAFLKAGRVAELLRRASSGPGLGPRDREYGGGRFCVTWVERVRNTPVLSEL
jgi:hypothetical protein